MAPPDSEPSPLERYRPDCERCFGLCCVATAFAASADFAIDKAAGEPCVHLQTDFRCGIHAALRQRGFPGCAVYDCFGAGQTGCPGDVRRPGLAATPNIAARMFEVFGIMRQLHELAWYLTEALSRSHEPALRAELRGALDDVERLTDASR